MIKNFVYSIVSEIVEISNNENELNNNNKKHC